MIGRNLVDLVIRLHFSSCHLSFSGSYSSCSKDCKDPLYLYELGVHSPGGAGNKPIRLCRYVAPLPRCERCGYTIIPCRSFESFHYDIPIVSNNVIFEVAQDATATAALRIRYDAAVTVVLGRDMHVYQKMRGNERKRIFLYSVTRAKVEEYVNGTVTQSDGFVMPVGNPQVNMIGLYVLGGNVDGVVKMKFRGRFAGRNGILDREMYQYGSQLSINALIFNEINVDVQAPVVVMKGVFLLAVRMIHGQRERYLFHSHFQSLKVDFFGQSHNC